MKKKLCCGLVLIVLFLSSSAQSPRIEVKGVDTLVTISLLQLRMANIKFIELAGCREENDSLFSQIWTYGGLVNNLRASITELKEANKLNETLISDKQKIIDLSAQELKKEVRRSRILRIQRNSLAGAIGIFIIKTAFFK